ncbi:MAG: DUF3048 domain-containing protein [Lachnospiraceae bacterium]|nr:DUF3048 domain-containing protein [Lachnospiraceae bacterium]
MKKTNKKTAFLAATMIAVMLLGGCGKKDEETTAAVTEEAAINVSPVATMEGSAEDIQVISKEGYILSDLTGEWIEDKYENQRPFCIMVNNISEAMPQAGLSQAAITYEILVEGGITRFLCVFDKYDDIEKLGPIRSARVPYVQLSKMYDGFFAHYGWSPTAQEMIESDSEVLSLNGLSLGETMYYRDPGRSAPHDVFTNSDLIAAGIESKGYSLEHDDSYVPMFSFNYKDKPLVKGDPKPGNQVITAYSDTRVPRFVYDENDGLYHRLQFYDPQIDANTGEGLAYKNVLILMVEYTSDETGYYRFVSWDKDMLFYYFTDGQYIVGNCRYEDGVNKLYYPDETELKLNPGQTFVTVFDYTMPASIIIE